MKFIHIFLLTIILGISIFAQGNSINGTVTDPSGSSVQGANVTLRRGAEVYTTTTDNQGRFSFPNTSDGKYQLTVSSSGFSVLTQEVSGGTSDLRISLKIAPASETVVVQSEVDSYLAETSTTGTKLDIPQRDLPQSVSVVTKNILDDRQVVRLTEASDNVSGVQALTGYSGTKTHNYLIRGFDQNFFSSSTLRNGFSEYAFLTQRDTVNVDRIEFLKGPASLLYGAADVGGLVNTITKKPLSENRFEASFTGGGFGLVRPTFDATGPITESKNLLYRVNFAFENGQSYRDFVNNRNIFVAPSLTWKISDRTTLLTEVEMGRFRNDFDRGFPTEPEFIDEERSNNYAEPWTSAINKNLNIMLNFTHVFNDKFSFRTGFNHVRSQTDLDATSFGFFAVGFDRRTINRTAIETDEYSENYNSQNEFYARFSTGNVRHQLVAGGEFARFQFKYLFDLFSLDPIDRINPTYGATRGFPLFGFDDDIKANQFGGYILDHIELLPNFKIMLGGRFSYVDASVRDYSGATLKNEQTESAFTPRAGIVYQPVRSTSLYFSYTSSFEPNFQARAESGEQFEPTTGRLFEGGIKQSFFNERVLATLAIYQLERRNVLVPDPNSPFFSIQTGEQRSRGIELEINGQVTRGLSLNTTYSAIDAIVTEDTRATYVGDRLVGVPKHSGGIYTNYIFDERVLRGFSIGGGVFFATDYFSNLPNKTFILPGYTRADVNFGYRRENWRFDLAIKNLNDVRYFETGGFNSMLPQPKRHALASVTYSF